MAGSPTRSVRADLIAAALADAKAGGPEAISLRKAANRVGLSHNAGYRHFHDRADLVAAVAGAARTQLHDAIDAELSNLRPTPNRARGLRSRLRCFVIGYTTFALAEPGLFRTACCAGSASPDAEHAMLEDYLDEAVEIGVLGADRRPHADLGVWSAVHGLAQLLVAGAVDREAAPIAVDAVVQLLEVAVLQPVVS